MDYLAGWMAFREVIQKGRFGVRIIRVVVVATAVDPRGASVRSATALANFTKVRGSIYGALMTFQVSPTDDGQNLRQMGVLTLPISSNTAQ
jgi:hypothetical protein